MWNLIRIRNITIWRTIKPKDKFEKIINEKLYPKDENNVTKLWNGIKKNILIDSKNPDEETEKYFQFSVQKLMESPGKFTFRKFSKYLQELCTELKLIGKNRLPEDQITGTFLQLRNQYNMMSYLTDEEFESDNHKIFTFETKKLISNSINVDIKDVDEMLLHHETCKIDRTWYFRRLILGRKLPTNYKERDYLSYQRPSLRLSYQVYPEIENLESLQIKKLRDKIHYNKPKTKSWPWFRHKTTGYDYFRTIPYTKFNKSTR